MFGWIRTRQCADDRDRVYGILGLPYLNHFPWNDCLAGMVPEYSVSISSLYLDVACRAVKKGGLMPLLNAVHHGPELEAWNKDAKPSWVPQWNEDFAEDLNIMEPNHKIGRVFVREIDEMQKSTSVDCICIDEIVSFSRNDLLLPFHDRNIDSIFGSWSEHVVSLANSKESPESSWTHIQFCDVFGAQIWTDSKKASLWSVEQQWANEIQGARSYI